MYIEPQSYSQETLETIVKQLDHPMIEQETVKHVTLDPNTIEITNEY